MVPDCSCVCGVERLAELHDVDTLSTQSGADRRSRVRSASRNLQLNEAGDFLLSHCHCLLQLAVLFISHYTAYCNEKPLSTQAHSGWQIARH